MKELCKAIKLNRIRKGLEPIELAAKADVNIKYYYALERGKHDPSVRLLARIAGALEIPLSDLIKEAEELEKEGE